MMVLIPYEHYDQSTVFPQSDAALEWSLLASVRWALLSPPSNCCRIFNQSPLATVSYY